MTDTATAAPIPKLLYTPREAAQALSVSRSSVYVLLASGALDSVRIGGCRRITAAALDAFVASLAAGPATATCERPQLAGWQVSPTEP